ncbi:MAG: peptidoglycan-binding protein [Haliscomenobacter sp.]|nr:peptidoglycan-binding protein [Haliscomenobacter sp.]
MQTLKLDSTGHAVIVLQHFLKTIGQPISVDGEFGPKTLAQVKAFQSQHKLRADGVRAKNLGALVRALLYLRFPYLRLAVFIWPNIFT